MDKQLATYDINEAHIAEVVDKYKGFALVPGDTKSKAVLMEGLKEHREIRLAIEKKRKANNEKANKYIKDNNTEGKRLHALNDPGEKYLKDIRQKEDDRINAIQEEAARKEKERIQKRVDVLAEYGKVLPFFDVAGMSDEIFETILTTATAEYEAEQARVAEAIRLEEEAKAKEEADRRAESKRLAKEREDLDRQKAEQEADRKRLAEIQVGIEAEQKAKWEKFEAHQAAIKKEIDEKRAAFEAEQKAAQEKKSREEFERKAKEKAEADAKAETERKQQEQAERERAEAEEKARQDALRPDKDKLLSFLQEVYDLSITYPLGFKDEKVQFVCDAFVDIIQGQIAKTKKEVEEL